MPVGGYGFKCHIEQRLSVSHSKVLEIIINLVEKTSYC